MVKLKSNGMTGFTLINWKIMVVYHSFLSPFFNLFLKIYVVADIKRSSIGDTTVDYCLFGFMYVSSKSKQRGLNKMSTDKEILVTVTQYSNRVIDEILQAIKLFVIKLLGEGLAANLVG